MGGRHTDEAMTLLRANFEMRLANLGIGKDLPTVVVLGAGASRGASCPRSVGIAPPIDSDFFVQAQRMPATKLLKRDRDLFAFIRAEFGQTDHPTLEVFFTQIAAVDRFHHVFNIRGRVSTKFGTHLATLRSLIPHVFAEALADQDCRWHQRIVGSLRAGDAVLSFNYDTLIDRALRSVAGKRWDPRIGYGFPIADGCDLWSSPPRPGPAVGRPILLLKPHGSLNWQIDGDDGQVTMVNEYVNTTAESIVPPTWDKTDVSEWPWNEVWRAARRALSSARMLVVIGYSVPMTDQLSQALLRADVNRLGALVIVNPDTQARRRVIELFSSALAPNATVVELQTLEDLASYLPRSTEEPPLLDLTAELKRLERQVQRSSQRLSDLIDEQHDFKRHQDELESTLEEISQSIDELNADGDLADRVQRLSDEINDLDSRIDSIVS